MVDGTRVDHLNSLLSIALTQQAVAVLAGELAGSIAEAIEDGPDPEAFPRVAKRWINNKTTAELEAALAPAKALEAAAGAFGALAQYELLQRRRLTGS